MSETVTAATNVAAHEAPNRIDDVAAEVGFKVFAGNLTYSTDEVALKNFFSAFNDDITSVQVIFHASRSAGFGFLTFKTDDAANKAIEALDKKELDGRPVIVEHARPMDHTKPKRHPFRRFGGRRGNKAVPGEATEAPNEANEAAVAAPAADGEAAAARPKKKRSPKKRTKRPAAEGAAEGTGDTANAVAEGGEAPVANGTERTKKPRRPYYNRRYRRGPPSGEPSKSVLFVANLAYSVDEAALTEFFTSKGITVDSVRVVRRFGKSKGYAFVDVGEEQQQNAIEAVQGQSIADREVTVKVALNSGRRDEGNAEGGVGDHVEEVAAA